MKVYIISVLYILCIKNVWTVPLSIQANLVEFCDTDNLLNSKDIALTESGQSSSKTVSLSPQTFAAVCKLKVSSPKNHIVNMQFVESNPMFSRALLFNNSEPHPPCTMSIYLPDDSTRPFWEGDPCSHETLPDVDLLTSDFEVVWAPPPNPNHTKGRKFIVTAVGKGGICKEPGKHTCMRIGRQPVFCISEKLLCDGIHHCPKSSSKSDESEDLCNDNFHRQNSWEQLAQEFAAKILKRIKPQPEEDFNSKYGWTNPKYDFTSTEFRKSNGIRKDWQLLQKKQPTTTTTTPKSPPPEIKPKQADSVSAMLSKYGPWGYLMMGLLICGTVLMFCGLWECCFRKPKNQIEAPHPTQPTTVLIINQGEDGPVVAPPNYDELDDPPSYNTLFPHYKTDTTIPTVTCCNLHSQNSITDNTSSTSFYSALTYVGEGGNTSLNRSNSETHVVQINRNNETSDSSTSVESAVSDTSVITNTSSLSEPNYGTPNDHLEGT